ncbi:MAG: ABC transporter ATP-binding protein [Chloroflexi bacterium]|nr:ABC transporter ATP-binding protein [Chloroflexota bacterium]
MASSGPAIETAGLCKEFGPHTAVANLTLTIGWGEVFGFLGPNGAGKTTSIKMLLGLVVPTRGEAQVLGAPLGDRRARARLGFLPEHFRFQDWLTAREFLQFHGRLYGMRGAVLAERIPRVLQRVDLHDAAERKLREFSKGMLQRVGLAQALLNQPDLVFLDEPTSGLDPLGRLLVRDVIAELRDAGTAVFLNSHILSEVEITCDRVAFVRRGEVVRELSLHDGSQQGVEVQIKVEAPTPGLLAELGQFGRDVIAADGVIRLHADNNHGLPDIARFLVGRGLNLYHLSASPKSLEQLFLEVMGDQERPG